MNILSEVLKIEGWGEAQDFPHGMVTIHEVCEVQILLIDDLHILLSIAEVNRIQNSTLRCHHHHSELALLAALVPSQPSPPCMYVGIG